MLIRIKQWTERPDYWSSAGTMDYLNGAIIEASYDIKEEIFWIYDLKAKSRIIRKEDAEILFFQSYVVGEKS